VNKLHVKVNDKVMIMAGVDAGKIGTVKKAMPADGRVIVENKENTITKMTCHIKPRRQGEAGGRIEMDRPIAAASVMLICPNCDKPTRLAHKVLENGTKVRVCKHCGQAIDQQ